MTKTKTTKRITKPPRVFWLRVEIEGSYKYAPELMQDVADDTACVTHVVKTEYMSGDELMENIRQGIRDVIRNGGSASAAPMQSARSASGRKKN